MGSILEPAVRGDSSASALPLALLQPLARDARAPASVGPLHPSGAADHASALHNCLDRPLLGGNLIELLIDNAQTEAAIFAAVRGARDHVHLECRALEPAGSGAELAALLIARRSAGVSVSLMLDDADAMHMPEALLARLRGAGVALARFNAPPDNWQNAVRRVRQRRDQRKLLIVDGRIAFIGGPAAVGSAAGPVAARDTHLRIEGPVVAHLQEAFVAHWVEQAGRQPSHGRHFPGLRSVGTQRAGVAVYAAGSRHNPFLQALLAAVERARGRVFITTAQFMPPRALRAALCAAARRGVDTRVLLSGDGAARAPCRRLLAAGVRLFELPGRAVHARCVVVDDEWAAVGSSSLDSASGARQASIDVIALDPVLAAQLESAFRDDQAVSRAVTHEHLSLRGYLPRLQQWTARRLEFLL